MNASTTETIYTYRRARKVHVSGSGFVALLFLIAAVVFLIPFWPLSLIFFALTIACDAKTKTIHHCDHCGNEVASTCRLCPTCRADLAPEPRKPFWIAMIRTLGLLAILASSLVLVWYVLRMR
jgi:uncharacterized membrane protein YhaH (DUF805 family)